MDLSKAYDCLRHDSSIAKLEAYGLDNDILNLHLDYLTFSNQRGKVGSAYNKWSKIRRRISPGPILGPILFNIFINDIFMIIEQSDICNFADDNALYSCGERLTKIKENLICDIKSIFRNFPEFQNHARLTLQACRLLEFSQNLPNTFEKFG